MDEHLFFDIDSHIDQTNGNLPHWNQNGKLYFVTFHLADSMPQSILQDLIREKDSWLKTHPLPWSLDVEKEYHYRFSQFVDKWLDANYGSCVLRNPSIAAIVESALYFWDGMNYRICSYVIMPNHVHVLVDVYGERKIQSIMHSWKSYTANRINNEIGKSGQVWWHESFDRIIRDEKHYCNVKNYIGKNICHGGVRWSL